MKKKKFGLKKSSLYKNLTFSFDRNSELQTEEQSADNYLMLTERKADKRQFKNHSHTEGLVSKQSRQVLILCFVKLSW